MTSPSLSCMPESADQHTPSMGSSFVSPSGYGTGTPGTAGASSDGTPSPSDLSAEISPHSLLGSSLGSSFSARPRSDLGHARVSRTIHDRSKHRKSSRRKSRRKNRRRNSDGDQARSIGRHAQNQDNAPVVASHSIIDPASSASASQPRVTDPSHASASSSDYAGQHPNPATPRLSSRTARFNPYASHPPRRPGGAGATPMRSHSTPRAPKTTGHSIYEGKKQGMNEEQRLSQSARRVLPDQSAFLENEGLGDSHASYASRGDATPGKKQCPPTPQRTPTWLAHSHGGSSRLSHSRRDEERDAGDSLDGLDGFVLNHFSKGAGTDAEEERDPQSDGGSLSADLIGLDDEDDNCRSSARRPRFASHSGVLSSSLSGGEQRKEGEQQSQRA